MKAFQVHSLYFRVWWQNCWYKSLYVIWFPLSCSHVQKVISMPAIPAIAFKNAACCSCFSHLFLINLKASVTLTNFFHHWLNPTSLHMLKIECFSQNTLLWCKMYLLYDFPFPFGLTSHPSHLSGLIFWWGTYLHDLHFTVSGESQKISPQIYQKSKSWTCRSMWELMIAGLVTHIGEPKLFYLSTFQSKLPLKTQRKKNEGYANRSPKYTDSPTSPSRSHLLEITACGGLLLSQPWSLRRISYHTTDL